MKTLNLATLVFVSVLASGSALASSLNNKLTSPAFGGVGGVMTPPAFGGVGGVMTPPAFGGVGGVMTPPAAK